MKKMKTTQPKARKRKSSSNEANLELIKQIANPAVLNCKSVKSNTQKTQQEDEQKYSLTPKGILYLALSEAIKQASEASKSGAEPDIHTADALVDTFVEALLGGLSLLATNGEDKRCLFGADFNEFFSMFINSMNLCGYLKQKLEENGIEFDKDDFESGTAGNQD